MGYCAPGARLDASRSCVVVGVAAAIDAPGSEAASPVRDLSLFNSNAAVRDSLAPALVFLAKRESIKALTCSNCLVSVGRKAMTSEATKSTNTAATAGLGNPDQIDNPGTSPGDLNEAPNALLRRAKCGAPEWGKRAKIGS